MEPLKDLPKITDLLRGQAQEVKLQSLSVKQLRHAAGRCSPSGKDCLTDITNWWLFPLEWLL